MTAAHRARTVSEIGLTLFGQGWSADCAKAAAEIAAEAQAAALRQGEPPLSLPDLLWIAMEAARDIDPSALWLGDRAPVAQKEETRG